METGDIHTKISPHRQLHDRGGQCVSGFSRSGPAQIEDPEIINQNRLKAWNKYYELLKPLEDKGYITLPVIPEGCVHNAHMFYIKTKDLAERTKLINFLKDNGIGAVFHYIPLHSAPAGKQFGVFSGEDKYTTKESERLTRLPLYYGITEEDVVYISSKVKGFYGEEL